MIIYWPGVYTFNGYFSEEDLQMFWVYRYKGFSFTAARTVHTALVLAGQQGCSQADTGHLLLALVQTAQGTAADFLRRKRVTSTALAEHTAAHAAGRPRRLHSRDLAPELSKAMEFAVLGAHAASAARAENEHLLCAILEDSSCTASRWLAALGIELPQAARECRQLSGQLVLPAQPRMAASRTGRPSDKYGRDLTRLAQEGRLDPVLCRDAELDRMIEILCRRQKNNPCLLGEPGVGKSALAEALAQRIAAGQITPALRGKPAARTQWAADQLKAAAIASRRLGLNAHVVGSKTARYFVPSAFLREFAAVMKQYLNVNVTLIGLWTLMFVALAIISTLLPN